MNPQLFAVLSKSDAMLTRGERTIQYAAFAVGVVAILFGLWAFVATWGEEVILQGALYLCVAVCATTTCVAFAVAFLIRTLAAVRVQIVYAVHSAERGTR